MLARRKGVFPFGTPYPGDTAITWTGCPPWPPPWSHLLPLSLLLQPVWRRCRRYHLPSLFTALWWLLVSRRVNSRRFTRAPRPSLWVPTSRHPHLLLLSFLIHSSHSGLPALAQTSQVWPPFGVPVSHSLSAWNTLPPDRDMAPLPHSSLGLCFTVTFLVRLFHHPRASFHLCHSLSLSLLSFFFFLLHLLQSNELRDVLKKMDSVCLPQLEYKHPGAQHFVSSVPVGCQRLEEWVLARYTRVNGTTADGAGPHEIEGGQWASDAESGSSSGTWLITPMFSSAFWFLSNAWKGPGKTWCKRKALCGVHGMAGVKPEGLRGEVAKAAIYSSDSSICFPATLLSASPVCSSLSLN